MRIKSLIFLVTLSLVLGLTHAGLWEPPITDPSFEAVENGADHSTLGNWGYIFDEWFENPDDTAVFWEKGTAIGLESDGNIWLGCETNGTAYQAIGTVNDGITYTVKALIGDRSGTSFDTGAFSIYAGGSDTDGADGIALDSFATLLDSAEVTTADGTLVSDNVYEVEVELLAGTGYAGETLWLEVKSVVGKDYFDRLEILSSDMASDPVPSNGADPVPVTQVLSWTAPTAFVPNGYYVYLSTDPNLPVTSKVVDGDNVTSYDPDPDLDYISKYYWRVDPIDPNDGIPTTVRGVEWTFTTAPAVPTILSDPVSTTVAAGSTVELTVSDIGGTTYTWYLVAEPADIEITSGPSSTLSIPNAQIGDEGYYYCVVSNSSGSATSGQARVMVQRLVGQWKLDGNLTNEVTGGGDGTGTDPNYVAGIDGSGLEFFGDGRTVVITDSAEYYNFYPQGMTVSVWVKTNTTGWDGVVSKQQRYDTWAGWTIDVTGGWSHFTVRGSTGDLWGTDDDGNMFDDGWHLVTAVIDPVTGTSRIYVDGVDLGGSRIIKKPVTNPEALAFGAETADGGIPYVGMLDEVSIWNYALDPLDIAQQYVDYFPDAELCIEPISMDFNGNCVVEIDDFVYIAESWLECYIVPTCIN
jgi:hypothetical protein